MHNKFVSVVIPCRNEEKFIGKCLDSILGQDYPLDDIEILVADGASEDKTRQIILGYAADNPRIRLFDNPKKIVPCALNALIKEAQGQVIVRIDVHSSYPSDYISKCVKALETYQADNVGGVWVTCPRGQGTLGEAIAFVLSHRFGVGNSLFRLGIKEPTEVDTVAFGCFRREVFDRVGFFNENLVRNQDIEFNLRLRKDGGKILLLPDVTSRYYARSDLKDLARNNFRNGFWVIYSMKFASLPFSVRHLVPFVFVVSLLAWLLLAFLWPGFLAIFSVELAIYLLFNGMFSLSIARQRGFQYLGWLMLSFMVLHFSYGAGSLCGLVRLLVP